MKTQTLILPTLAALLAAGCNSSPYSPQPIPAQPVVAVPAQLPAVTAAPAPSAVTGVEVRTTPVAPSVGPKTKAVLFVQNHSGVNPLPMPLSTLGDWLQTALASGPFAVVNPHDVVGEAQNVGPWGEKMPASSATRLTENLGAPVLLTAAVTSARVHEIGGTEPGRQAVLEFTLSAKAVPGGEGLASVNASARSRKEESEIAFARKAANTWSEVAKEAAFSAAAALGEQYAAAKPALPVAPTDIRVAFVANVPGANVRIDGVSYGTVGTEPRLVRVSPGLHNVEVAYPGLVGFKDVAKIQEETTFQVSLALTAEGEAAKKRDALFAATLERMQKSGATDDLVREIVAKGYGNYLSTSHTQIEGMPQTLSLQQSTLPSLGLSPDGVSPNPGPTTDQLLQKASDLAK